MCCYRLYKCVGFAQEGRGCIGGGVSWKKNFLPGRFPSQIYFFLHMIVFFKKQQQPENTIFGHQNSFWPLHLAFLSRGRWVSGNSAPLISYSACRLLNAFVLTLSFCCFQICSRQLWIWTGSQVCFNNVNDVCMHLGGC